MLQRLTAIVSDRPTDETAPGRVTDRERLRLLDSCLERLEDAHECDQVRVSEALARQLNAFLAGIRPGISS